MTVAHPPRPVLPIQDHELRCGVSHEAWANAQSFTEALVVGFCQRYRVRRQDDRDDARAEALYGLAVALERYDGERDTSFSTYAGRWVCSRLATWGASYKRRTANECGGLGEDYPSPDGPFIGNPQFSVLQRRAFEEWMEQVQTQERRVLGLRFQEGYTLQETARTTGSCLSTARNREKRGLRNLRKAEEDGWSRSPDGPRKPPAPRHEALAPSRAIPSATPSQTPACAK